MTNEELVSMIQAGVNVQENMSQLWTQNQGLIGKTANQYSSVYDVEDLKQEAYFGLAKAAERYDPAQGTVFTTYAEYWIRQTISRYCHNCGRLKRLPVHMLELISKYQKFRNVRIAETGDEPTDDEIALHLEIEKRSVNTLKRYVSETSMVSVDQLIPGADDFTIGDTIPAEGCLEDEVIFEIAQAQGKKALWEIVGGLRGRSGEVLERRYKQGKSLGEIGLEMGVSKERIRQLELKAIRILRGLPSVKTIAEIYDYTGYGIYHDRLGHFKNTGSSRVEQIAIARADSMIRRQKTAKTLEELRREIDKLKADLDNCKLNRLDGSAI